VNRDSDKYRLLIENLPDAFAYHQIVTDDDGKPVDYIFLEANTAFEEMTGLERSEVIGKKVTQVHPKIKKSALDWIGVYGKVAQGGEAIRFEKYFEPSDRWYEVCAYSDEPGYFVAVFRDISRHKNMEINLHDMSGRLKAIIDNSPLLISEFDPDGQYLMANKAVANLLNMEASEVEGIRFEDFLPPETVNLFNKRISSVVSKKEPVRVDDQITVNDKSYYYMTTLFPLCDSSGRVSSIGSIAHDITDRIEVENTLRKSEELLARSQQIAHIGSWNLDLRTNHLTWTDEVYRIFGIRPQEFTATYEAFLNAVHPDDRMAVNEAYTSSIREERDEYVIEHRIVRRDTGEIRTVHERCVHERDGAGVIIRSIGMVQDITERKKAEQEVNLQKERLANIVEGANVGTWEWNVQTGETIFNERWAEMIGYTLEEISPVSIETWIKSTHSDDLGKSNRELTKLFNGEINFYNVECRMKHKNGHWVWVNDRGKVISWSEDGKPLWVFGTHIDITDRKKTEEALKHQARERAAVDTFTYSVSNDLQAPLRRIEGFSEALQEECPGQLNDQARDYLNRITTQIGSMKKLTDALLQLSRVVSRKIDREEVDLSALIRSNLEKLQYQKTERQLELVVAPDLIVEGDAELLNLMLANLLDNAWKFTSGVKEARIEFGSTEKDGRTVYYLKDNGVGFDMNHAEKLFVPFHKLHSDNNYPGIGIGLNLVYRIISRHGGEIWAEGEPGKGACFCFTLP